MQSRIQSSYGTLLLRNDGCYMELFLFIKIIADMFYAIPILDYILLVVSLAFFIVSLRNIDGLCKTDYFALFFMCLLTLTIIRTSTGFNHYIKMISSFILYFIGRGYPYDIEKVKNSVVKANYIAIALNLTLFILGMGFIYWGNSLTFRGMYFYKTDFSMAMIYAIVSIAFFEKKSIKFKVLLWIIVSYLILRSNTRIAMIILFSVLFIWILYIREEKKNITLKLNYKYIFYSTIGIVSALVIVSKLLTLPIFEKYHFLSLNISSLSDAFSRENTQGRNDIWENIIKIYQDSSVFDKLFGIDFVSDIWNGYESHNTYLKILFSTGLVGLSAFVAFVIFYFVELNKIADRKIFYFNLSILLTFLVQGISQSAIDFTQMTWIFMFFIGHTITLTNCSADNNKMLPI